MKKFLGLLMIIISLALFGCAKKEVQKIKVLVPSGTPLVAIGGVLGNENYEVDVVSGADLLTAALVADEYDVVIAPVTAATKLYIAKGIKYRFASVINLSSNYLITLNGSKLDQTGEKRVLAYGMNNTPDIIMKAALANYDVSSFTIEYQQAVTDVVPFIVSNNGDYDFFLTAEPTLTQLSVKYGLSFDVIDLQKELQSSLSIIPQAGIFVNSESEKQAEIKTFLNDVKKNIEYLNKNQDKYYDKVSSYNEFFTKLTKEVLEKSIARSNIKYYEASKIKGDLDKYYDLLNNLNDKLLNGKKPDDDFYY